MIKVFKRKSKLAVRTNNEYDKILLDELFNRNTKGNDYIDESTYHDLDMPSLFSKIDFTSTTPGRQELYRILRSPSYNKDELNKKEEVYKYFKENSIKRNSINKALDKLATNNNSTFDVFEKPLDKYRRRKFKYNFGACLYILSNIIAITIASSLEYYLLIILPALLINQYIRTSGDSQFVRAVKSTQYICKMINSCEVLIKNTENSPFDVENRLKLLNKKLKYIGKKSSTVNAIKAIPIIGMSISLSLLMEERLYFRITKEIKKHVKEITELYNLIGSLDASLSVIDYRDSLSEFILPEFTCEKNYFNIKDIKHPLVEGASGNDFKSKSNGLVITGSNMSGKSTFLRSLGINNITAQTINTVIAKEYKTSFFKVVSSISLRDDIHKKKSYYKGEADAIKRVIDQSNGDKTILSLIDEIFKGTNPVERISGASEILNYIVKGNVFSVVTTHDINLLPLLDSYDKYYFSETIENNKLKFDYKIKQGTSPGGNAAKILDIMGYPKTIINKIYKTIDVISKEEAS